MAARSQLKKQHVTASVRARSYALPCTLLFLGVFLLYAGAYRYPLIFDDQLINPVQLTEYVASCAKLAVRCLSYSTFGLTYLAAAAILMAIRVNVNLPLACLVAQGRDFLVCGKATRRHWIPS